MQRIPFRLAIVMETQTRAAPPSGKGRREKKKEPIIAAPIYAYITRFVYIYTTSLSANGLALIRIGRI